MAMSFHLNQQIGNVCVCPQGGKIDQFGSVSFILSRFTDDSIEVIISHRLDIWYLYDILKDGRVSYPQYVEEISDLAMICG